MSELFPIHKIPMLVLKGKSICTECLASLNVKKTVRFQNLSALNKIPAKLRDNRFSSVLNMQRKQAKSFMQFVEENKLTQLKSNIFWIQCDNMADTLALSSAVINERLIRHQVGELIDLDLFLSDLWRTSSNNFNEFKMPEVIYFQSVILNDFDFGQVSKLVFARMNAYLKEVLKAPSLYECYVVFFSSKSLSDVCSMPYLKNTFLPYESMITEIKLNKQTINNQKVGVSNVK